MKADEPMVFYNHLIFFAGFGSKLQGSSQNDNAQIRENAIDSIEFLREGIRDGYKNTCHPN